MDSMLVSFGFQNNYHSLMAQNNRNGFSPSCGGQKPETEMRTGLFSLQGRILPCCFQLQWLQVFLGLWTYNPNLCLSPHMAFFSSICLSYRWSLIRTIAIVFRDHLNNPGCSHLKVLNLITYGKNIFPIRLGNIHRFWGFGCRHIFQGATIQSTTESQAQWARESNSFVFCMQ